MGLEITEEVEKIPSHENKEVSRDKAFPKVIEKDGMKMRRVSEKTILDLISRPLPPMRAYSAEFMRCKMGLSEEDIAVLLRGFQASQDVDDFVADVIDQYKANGCAYLEIPHEDFKSKLVEEERRVQEIVQALERNYY